MTKKYWDIECYENLFLAGFLSEHNHLDMHYLVESKEDEDEILRALEDIKAQHKHIDLTYTAYNLRHNALPLVKEFNTRPPSDGQDTILSSFLGVEEEKIEPVFDWYYSFNGLHYDLQMMQHVISTIVSGKVQASTQALRKHSDTIIKGTARRVNTKPYERHGNHVDVAYINDSLVQKGKLIMGLKTIVGIKGGSILESKSNKTGVSKNIYDDVWYNFNDIIELRDVVMPGKLADDELVFSNLLEQYESLKRHGITKNNTSAKFVEFTVSPDRAIDDIPVVDFTYPAKHIAKEHGVEQKNMLKRTYDWYVKNVYEEVKKHNPDKAKRHFIKFTSIINLYQKIEGKNWNTSSRHFNQFNILGQQKEERTKLMEIYGTHLPLIDKYGNDSYTYVNFSIGGIHGAEINKAQFEQDREVVRKLKKHYKYISNIPKGRIDQTLLNIIKEQSRTQYKNYPVQFSHEIPLFYLNTQQVDEIVDPEDFTPFQVIKKKNNKTGKTEYRETLLDRYIYVSQGHMLHQDFAGYYPMLMINLGVFRNADDPDDKIDVYNQIYKQRLFHKAEMKKHKKGTREWTTLDNLQNGEKLILNSASGILDGNHDTNLRANNKSLVMRILGQLFTWTIAQAVALEGAKVPSSNTDGIYVSNITLEKNREILDRELKELLVNIEPEEVFLVSKDSNNRFEMEHGEVTAAAGGMLAAYRGARVDKRLSHPALHDAVLIRYLQEANIDQPIVDRELIKKVLHKYWEETPKREAVIMASWIMRPVNGSIMIDDQDRVYDSTIRAFLTHDGIKLNKYTVAKKQRSKNFDDIASSIKDADYMGDPEVVKYLNDLNIAHVYFNHAVTAYEYTMSNDKTMSMISKEKISGLPEDAYCYINNKSLLKMSDEEIEEIFYQINEDAYIDMVASSAKKWHNIIKPAILPKKEKKSKKTYSKKTKVFTG